MQPCALAHDVVLMHPYTDAHAPMHRFLRAGRCPPRHPGVYGAHPAVCQRPIHAAAAHTGRNSHSHRHPANSPGPFKCKRLSTLIRKLKLLDQNGVCSCCSGAHRALQPQGQAPCPQPLFLFKISTGRGAKMVRTSSSISVMHAGSLSRLHSQSQSQFQSKLCLCLLINSIS